MRRRVAAARTIDADSSKRAVFTILSNEPLDVPGSFIAASRVPDTEGKWTYRYVGGRLLAYANDRWFLIVAPRQHGYRSTIFTLHDADNLRPRTEVEAELARAAAVARGQGAEGLLRRVEATAAGLRVPR